MTKELIICIVNRIAQLAATSDSRAMMRASEKMLGKAYEALPDSEQYDISTIPLVSKNSLTDELQMYVDFLHKQINGVNNNE